MVLESLGHDAQIQITNKLRLGRYGSVPADAAD